LNLQTKYLIFGQSKLGEIQVSMSGDEFIVERVDLVAASYYCYVGMRIGTGDCFDTPKQAWQSFLRSLTRNSNTYMIALQTNLESIKKARKEIELCQA